MAHNRTSGRADLLAGVSGNRSPRHTTPPRYGDAHPSEGNPGGNWENDRTIEGDPCGHRDKPVPPVGKVHPHSAPVDVCSGKLNASTVFVGNIHWKATETEVLELFNSVGGEYGNREHNIVVAAKFGYQYGRFQGRAYLLYSTVELAEFAVWKLHDRKLRGRALYVRISNCRFDTNGLDDRCGNVQIKSRSGPLLWDVGNA